MPRGYRCILVAFVGWLSLAAVQQPDKQKQGNTSANQAQATIPPEPPYAAYPNKNSDACYGAKDHDAADLCAQWRAAIATEKAAHEARRATAWAIVAAFLGLITVGGLIISIWQTFGALGEARRGNLIAQRANARATRQAIRGTEDTKAAISAAERQANIAEDTAARQLRAYLSPSAAWLDIQDDGRVKAHVHIKNYGATPATNERHWISIWVASFPLDEILEDAPDNFEMGSAVLGPGGHNEMVHPRPKPLTEANQAIIVSGFVGIYVYGKVTYNDIYGEEHMSRYVFVCAGDEAFANGRLAPYREGNTCE
jgi:hypothetical protein